MERAGKSNNMEYGSTDNARVKYCRWGPKGTTGSHMWSLYPDPSLVPSLSSGISSLPD